MTRELECLLVAQNGSQVAAQEQWSSSRTLRKRLGLPDYDIYLLRYQRSRPKHACQLRVKHRRPYKEDATQSAGLGLQSLNSI
jgi:uncharacterized short protein YbdD (DUF466 family)